VAADGRRINILKVDLPPLSAPPPFAFSPLPFAFCLNALFWFKMSAMQLSFLVALLILISGWGTAFAGSPRTVTLFFTGYVQGNFAPCG
jgi:hypothetical protein